MSLTIEQGYMTKRPGGNLWSFFVLWNFRIINNRNILH
uniref:Uncharacterized protein n=1 Tax=Siphoviridae sp. ctVqj4 TaxID=2826359 RepID=A0A8S5NK52_9CAUD|nr:MAG TPA: hypothetical protein [Siphoviridae sp. ctVqj4]